MTTNHYEKIEQKYQRRDQKKRKKMKISGKSVFGLKQIIVSKNQKNKT